MNYPKGLIPATAERIQLPSGELVRIAKATPIFQPWTGEKVTDSYGGKAVLNFADRPQFAELGILGIFKEHGWEGVWVDTYRHKFRTSYWPKDSVALPKDKALLLKAISAAADSQAGCFDVFCWKGGDYIFVESKRRAKDKLRGSQKRWIQAALKCGVPPKSLLIVEWEFETATDRPVRKASPRQRVRPEHQDKGNTLDRWRT